MSKTRRYWRLSLMMLSGLFMLNSIAVSAEPAHWFKWESKFNGKMICKQLSPGEGWQQHAGPFYDARCRKLVPRFDWHPSE